MVSFSWLTGREVGGESVSVYFEGIFYSGDVVCVILLFLRMCQGLSWILEI